MRLIAPMLVLALALPVAAQDAPRFAFFNLQQLVETSKTARAIYAELEVANKNLGSKLQERATRGQQLQQQLQSGALSADGKAKLEKELQELQAEFDKLREESTAELRKVQTDVMGRLEKKYGPVVKALAEERKLQVVFNTQATQIVEWADDAWMKGFTAEVAARLEKAEGTAAAPAPVAATKPASKPAGGKK